MFIRRIRHTLAAVVAAIDVDRDDAKILLGLALLATGLWMIYRPSAFIAIGVVLLWTFLPARPPWIERSANAERGRH